MNFAVAAVDPGGSFESCSQKGGLPLTIRVTTSTDGETTTICIEGRLTAADLPDLRAECQSADFPLRLDLSGLKSADEDGIQALRLLSEEGAELHAATPYVRQLLRQADK